MFRMSPSKIGTIVFSAGNVFIAFALIVLVYMTRRNMPKVYHDHFRKGVKTEIHLVLCLRIDKLAKL